jgi:hypothetical protein
MPARHARVPAAAPPIWRLTFHPECGAKQDNKDSKVNEVKRPACN